MPLINRVVGLVAIYIALSFLGRKTESRQIRTYLLVKLENPTSLSGEFTFMFPLVLVLKFNWTFTVIANQLMQLIFSNGQYLIIQLF